MTLAVSGLTFPCHRLTVGRRSSPVQTREQSEEVRTSSLFYQATLGRSRDTFLCSGTIPSVVQCVSRIASWNNQFTVPATQNKELGKWVIEEKEEKQSKQMTAKGLTLGDETLAPCTKMLIFLLYIGMPNTNIKADLVWLFSLHLMQLDQLWYH